MKDPLQTSETPYEVLGIEPGLSDEDLRKAYFEAIRKRVPAAKATEAYNTLRRPVERARIALTQYDVNALKQLNPCPIDGDPALQVSHRAATAKAWENRLKETFPEAGTIHSLAVLWYWWTQHEEQRYSLIVDAVRRPEESGTRQDRQALAPAVHRTQQRLRLRSGEPEELPARGLSLAGGLPVAGAASGADVAEGHRLLVPPWPSRRTSGRHWAD